MAELRIIAKIVVKKEFQKELEQTFHVLVDETRKEEGNISYELHQSVSNPLDYVIVEIWKSQDAINIHNASTHFSAFKNAIDGKLDSLAIDVIRKVY